MTRFINTLKFIILDLPPFIIKCTFVIVYLGWNISIIVLEEALKAFINLFKRK